LIREAVAAALEDAGITSRDVDAVVIGGAQEAFGGINQPEHWIGPAMGVPGKPLMRIQTDGTAGAASAISAFYHVSSGLFDVVLAVAYEKPSDCTDAWAISPCGDPLWDLDLSCGAAALAGLQARQYLARHDPRVSEEHGAMVVVKNRLNATRNPNAHLRHEVTIEEVMGSAPVATPIKELDCHPLSDGAAAMVIAEERRAKKMTKKPAWFAGIGTSSESPYSPHADKAYPESCVRAAQVAYQMAWIYDPVRELDLAEVHEAFSYQELIWTEVLGLCNPGEGGRMVESGITALGGEFPVNPSGGVLSTNPPGTSAMIRQLEAARQVMGKAGDHQVPGVRKALAHSWGGALQFSTVTIFAGEL
jgi:acetyl-CoA C-acetyltransferase